jgi:hypothetical protein
LAVEDYVLRGQRPAGHQPSDVVHRVLDEMELGIFRDAANVRAEHHIRQPEQFRAQVWRLVTEGVQARAAEWTALESGDQRGFIYDRPARRVHQYRTKLHHRELTSAEHPPGLFVERNVQADDVCVMQQFVQGRAPPRLDGRFSGRAAEIAHLGAKRAHQSGDMRADLAKAEQPDSLAAQLIGVFAHRPLLPDAADQPVVCLG